MLTKTKSAFFTRKSLISCAIFSAFLLTSVTSGFADSSSLYDENTSPRYETRRQIDDIFNNLETVDDSSSSMDGSDAGRLAMDSACQMGVNKLISSDVIPEFTFGYSGKFLPEEAAQYIKMKGRQLGQNAASSLCAALRGDSVVGVDLPSVFKDAARSEILPMLMMVGQGMAHGTGLPFLSRLEIQLGSSDRDLVSSITTVQPIWQSESENHYVFSQLSYYRAPDDTDEHGFRTQYDTVNAGIAYRYLTDAKDVLYGINTFFDRSLKHDHNRMSIGVDARTSQLAFSANRYFPISDWKTLDLYYEEKAAAGWDLMLRGQIPQLPSWTASIKGYEWDNQDDGENLYGITTAVEYSPVPALALRVGVRDESQNSASIEAGMRFNWRFDQPSELQWRQRTELAPVSSYVYSKVERENIIRVQTRRKASSMLTVVQTSGVNTAVDSNGSRALQVGQVLSMPATVTVANSVGAIGRLHIGDGGYLTAGQNTQVRIEPNLITLMYGTMQYVSGSTIHNINVPGGTIVLHGTDIDVVSNGTDSSVRVRDGSITFTGTVSGAATLAVEELAKSVSGVVGGSLAPSSGTYISHTDTVSVDIDRVAQVQEGEKVAPYPYQAPRIVTETLQVGQSIIIGLRYNSPVVVTGTPRLNLTIGGNNRTAAYLSGSGSEDLHFDYVVQPSDIGETNFTVTSLDKNGGTMRGNGKDAVITIADTTLSLSGPVGDSIAPSGYTAAFTTDPVISTNVTAAAFSIVSAEVGTTYNYTITSSGGGAPVTGSGTVTAATQVVSGINLSGLTDGTLTVSVTLTDSASNVGSAVTDTVVKDTGVPSGYTAALTTDPVTQASVASAAFSIASAEVGTTYTYSISSSGGGVPVTGTGSVSAATVNVTGVNLTSIPDGTLTLSVALSDASGNAGSAATDTGLKDTAAPSGYATAFVTDPINAGNANAVAFNITSAEVGAGYAYTITSSGGGAPVTGSGTVAGATENITGLNLSTMADGTLTVSVVLTDTNGNAGAAVTDTVAKDTGVASGYAVAFTTSPVNDANKAAAAFNITSAEVGTTYNYSITSSGGGGTITGSGTVASATQAVTGVDVSSLPDGTLTASVTLTDGASNVGAAATGTVVKDATLPSGYAVAFTSDPVSAANVTLGAISITSAEVGSTYAYSITSSGGGTPVTGTATVMGATQNVTGIDLSGLTDGTLTVSVTLTDTSGNAGAAATDTVVKDVTAPSGYAAAFTTSPVNDGNKSAAAFNITSAEVGAAYSYSITSSGGGTAVTGSGTVASATQSVTGLNLSGLNDGTLTVSVTLTDTHSNAGSAVTGTTSKDVAYSVVFTTDPVYSANYTAATFNISSAEVGSTYNYTITTSGGAGTVTGSGTIATATQTITADTTAAQDGTLTVSITLTDPSGNVGAAATDTVVKDIVAPTITSVTPPANGTYEP